MTTKKWLRLSTLLFSFVMIISLLFPSIVSAASSQRIDRVQTSSKVVALTFDDGSDGGNVNKIRSILNDNNIKATFFLTGAATKIHPSLIKNITTKAHDIGNHSYNHPDFTKQSAAQIKDQLARTESVIKNATGKTSKPLFRPPFGYVNSSVLKAVGDAGYTKTIMWTIDTIDWRGDSASAITNRVMTKIVPGAIVLMHTGAGTHTTEALPKMISQLKSKEYKFVTVPQLLTYTSNTGTPTGNTYTVKAGDTLYNIARKYNVTVAQLVSTNKIKNSNVISIGQVLKIPGKTTTPPPTSPPKAQTKYTVKAGDTLYGIARKYNVTVAQLVSTNKIKNSSIISIGQVLTIPGKTTTPPPTSPPKVKAKHTVKSRETVYSIARKYKVTVQEIVLLNKLANANLIRVGQVLVIPN